jgi:hypothetical protein
MAPPPARPAAAGLLAVPVITVADVLERVAGAVKRLIRATGPVTQTNRRGVTQRSLSRGAENGRASCEPGDSRTVPRTR